MMFLGSEDMDEGSRCFPEGDMRKQELVHLHGLLVEITESLVDEGAIPANIWNEYETLEIDACCIQARKSDHEEAVLILATTLTATLERPAEEQSSISVRN